MIKIPGYDNYYLSDDNRILDGRTGVWLIERKNKRGEPMVNIRVLDWSMHKKVRVEEIIQKARSGDNALETPREPLYTV